MSSAMMNVLYVAAVFVLLVACTVSGVRLIRRRRGPGRRLARMADEALKSLGDIATRRPPRQHSRPLPELFVGSNGVRRSQ